MRKRGFFYKRGIENDNLINLTPLIDLIFVILVSFIIIFPFLAVDKVSLVKAEKETDIAREEQKIKIYVREDNSIWINNEKIAINEIVKKFYLLKKNFPNKNILLYHDRKAYFETYQLIKNGLEKAGFETLDVVLKKS